MYRRRSSPQAGTRGQSGWMDAGGKRGLVYSWGGWGESMRPNVPTVLATLIGSARPTGRASPLSAPHTELLVAAFPYLRMFLLET